mgnify:FL=1
MRNIILCGFMGCGKSTVGRVLAQMTGRTLVDTDTYIEAQAGMTVSAIFARFGEADFRRREREACAALAGESDLVIAAGGGALTFSENVRVLSATGDIVLLEVSAETVLKRLEGDTTRPLLQRADKETAVRELMAARAPLYRQAAAFTISGEAAPETTAKAILAALGQD